VLDAERILRTSGWSGAWRSPTHVQDYAVRTVLATHPTLPAQAAPAGA
jgi:hypothetical protein